MAEHDVAEEAVVEDRVICGFWQRVLAWFLDGLIIGLAGMLIGLTFFDFLAMLGGWARLFGFCIALPYYAVLNSSIGNGQTFGKRILKIKVVNGQGGCIGVGRSALRYTVFSIPFFLNGALIPPQYVMSALGILLSLLIFGVGGSVIYLYIFNRRTRQSLHDIVSATYVVKSETEGAVIAESVWRGHMVVVSLLMVASIGVTLVMIPMTKKGVIADAMRLQNAVYQSGKVHTASLMFGKSRSMGGEKKETRYINVNAILKRRPANIDKATKEIAAILLKEDPVIVDSKDYLHVTVTFGYDMGIAKAWRSNSESHTPSEWHDTIKTMKAGDDGEG